MNFLPGIKLFSQQEKPGFWFVFSEDKLLVGEHFKVPYVKDLSEINLKPIRTQYLGELNGKPCYSAELPSGIHPPKDMFFEGLRQLYGQIEDEFFPIAGYAVQIVLWDRTHQYCGQCGTSTEYKENERAKFCPNCGLTNFPRISPAIIVAITKGNQILLARGNRFNTMMYSVLAGFVEPGENLEECVRREVGEEVGIGVKNISYFGSQPWPFPNSLMIAFTAEYDFGEINIDGEEILDAGWYTVEDLPMIPGKLSIARRLIDWFIDNN